MKSMKAWRVCPDCVMMSGLNVNGYLETEAEVDQLFMKA